MTTALRKKGGTAPEAHGNWYTLRIQGTLPDGAKKWRRRSCEAATTPQGKLIAEGIRDRVNELRSTGGERGRLLLQRVFDGKLSLPDMIRVLDAEADKVRELDGVFVTLSVGDIAARALRSLTDLPLAKLVGEWEKKAPRDLIMVRRLQSMFPADCPHRLDWFTAGNLNDLINNLKPRVAFKTALTAKAKQMYRVALSSFAEFLKDEKLIPANPTQGRNIRIKKDKRGVDKDAGKIRFYTDAQVQKLCCTDSLLDIPRWDYVRVLVAIAFSTGAEFGAMSKMKKESLLSREDYILLVPGTKNDWREQRECMVSIEWCWPLIESYFDSLADDQWIMPRAKRGNRYAQEEGDHVEEHEVRDALKEACRRTGVPYHAFHKLRHSLAVHWIRAGILIGKVENFNEEWLQGQLGHKKGSTLLRTVYGKYDYQADNRDRSSREAAARRARAAATIQAGVERDWGKIHRVA